MVLEAAVNGQARAIANLPRCSVAHAGIENLSQCVVAGGWMASQASVYR
jgi:hypothetical protein